MLQYKLWWQPQIIDAKICFMNQKCFRWYLTKVDFEHADPLPRVLGPAAPGYKQKIVFLPTGCLIQPAVGSLESWVIVTGENDFVLQF